MKQHLRQLYEDIQVGKINRLEAAISLKSLAQQHKSKETPNRSVNLEDKLLGLLFATVSKLLKVKVEDMDADAEWGEYGFDSVTFTELTNALNDQFRFELSPTVFFEYGTLRQFTRFLLKEYQDALALIWGPSTAVPKQSVLEKDKPKTPDSIRSKTSSKRSAVQSSTPKLESQRSMSEPIAIIGMSGTFPMAPNLDKFWDNLVHGRDCITEIPERRWNWRDFEDDPFNIKWGGFMEEADKFDPLFFGISPLEAERMDPNQRLLMTYVWKAMEDAGYSAQSLSGTRTAIFAAIGVSGYSEQLARKGIDIEGFSSTGMIPSVGPNRMSYFLNLRGPSEPIETACSSSLVAIHRAITALRDGSCSMAFAGGINTIVSPDLHLSFSKAGMLSSDGRCKTFSNKANGYVRGEGAGMLLLKRLQDAEAEGDRIYGVIRGSGINHGGRANSLTAPNPKAQAELLQTVYHQTGIDPASVTYIETHGTGTELGDPIEIQAIKSAFDQLYDASSNPKHKRVPCGLGSVKSNIGHLELAAGMAGVIKVLLQMKHKTLVPSLHCDELNPLIHLQGTSFYIVRETCEWETNQNELHDRVPRRAGVSSFGFGGVNAHIVIEEYISLEHGLNSEDDLSGPVMIVLSAKNEERLNAKVHQLLSEIQKGRYSDADLDNMAYTLLIGRDAMESRMAMTVSTVNELERKLTNVLQGRGKDEGIFRGHSRGQSIPYSLAADEDMLVTFENWFEKGKYERLLELWVLGMQIPWAKLYTKRKTKPKRISIPTYPFDEKSYWLADGIPSHPVRRGEDSAPEALEQAAIQDIDGEVPVEAKELRKTSNLLGIERFMHSSRWEAIRPERYEHTVDPSSVLIVYHASSHLLAEAIGKQMQVNYGKKIVKARLGDRQGQSAPLTWDCDMNNPDAFADCLEFCGKLEAIFFISESMLHAQEPGDKAIFVNSIQRNEIQLLRLIHSLNHLGKSSGSSFECYIITQNNGGFVEEEKVNPYGGGLTGLSYSIAQGEHRFKVRNLDVSSEECASETTITLLANQIIAEPPSSAGEAIKLRHNRRFKQVFYQLAPLPMNRNNTFRNGGVYVIMGGAGTLGNIISRYLMQEFDAKVVWIGRRPATSPEIRKKINELRSFGEPPLYIQANAESEEEMVSAIAQIKDRFAQINGAIFAGIVLQSNQTLCRTTESEFLHEFNVKARGSFYFYNALRHEKLDFLCFFSSAQAFSFSGASKFPAYAAGIAFSDTLARYIRKTSNFPIGILNWGFWRSSIRGSLLSVNEQRIGMLEDEDGLDCFKEFIYLLRRNALKEILCMNTDLVKNQMNLREDVLLHYNPNGDLPLESLDWKLEAPGALLSDLKARLKGPADPDRFEERVAKLLFVRLKEMGAFAYSVGELTDIYQKARVIPKYKRWFEESLGILQQYGFIEVYEHGIRILTEDDPADIIKEWDHFIATCSQIPDMVSKVRLVGISLGHLREILQGEIPATEILFPGASMELMERIYKNNSLSDYFNDLVARAAEHFVKARLQYNDNRKIRIAELGAGTGGTTEAVLARLKPYGEYLEYIYTDISPSFLQHGRDRFSKEFPNMIFKLWNAEKRVSEQDIEKGMCDMIIASNVIHATKDIRLTLGHIKAALKADGLLLLNEMSQKSPFLTVTFGLLDGWWMYEDEGLRIPGSPLLTPSSWRQALKEEGFRNVHFPAEGAMSFGQQIIMAVSDGWAKESVPEYSSVNTLESIQPGAVRASRPHEEKGQSINEGSLGMHTQGNPMIDASGLENITIRFILESLSQSLDIPAEQIDSSIGFSDYGVDSIVGVKFIDRINQKLGISINNAVIFDYTSVKRLAGYLLNTYQKEMLEYAVSTAKRQVEMNQPEDTRFPVNQNEEESGIEELENLFLQNQISAEALLDRIKIK